MTKVWPTLALLYIFTGSNAEAVCPYDVNCLNNAYGGRGVDGAEFVAPTYGPAQANAAFGAGPLHKSGATNPFAPSLPAGEDTTSTGGVSGASAPASSPSAASGRLQGVDPDQVK